MVKRDIMQRYHVPEDRIVVIHNGTDTEKFNAKLYKQQAMRLRKNLNISENDLVFLFLGSGYERKGLDVVLKAFARYVENGFNAKLLVVGYDSSLVKFKTLAKNLGVLQFSHFLGGRRDPEVLYAASNLYLLPTRYDPFANSTVEALSSGLPVVTSNSNGGCELLENNVSGSVFQFDGGEVNSVYEAMKYWSDSKALEKGKIAARKVAVENNINEKLKEATNLLEDLA